MRYRRLRHLEFLRELDGCTRRFRQQRRHRITRRITKSPKSERGVQVVGWPRYCARLREHDESVDQRGIENRKVELRRSGFVSVRTPEARIVECRWKKMDC